MEHVAPAMLGITGYAQPGQKPWSNPSLQTKFRNSIQFEKQPWDDIAPGMVLSIGLWRLLRMVIGCGCNWILYDFIFFTLYNTWSGKILHFVCLRLKKGVAFGPASVDAGLDYTWPYSNSEVHTNQRRIDTSIPIQCEPIPRTMKKALMKMFPACPCFSLWKYNNDQIMKRTHLQNTILQPIKNWFVFGCARHTSFPGTYITCCVCQNLSVGFKHMRRSCDANIFCRPGRPEKKNIAAWMRFSCGVRSIFASWNVLTALLDEGGVPHPSMVVCGGGTESSNKP